MNEYERGKTKLKEWIKLDKRPVAERYLDDYRSSLDSQHQDLETEKRTVEYFRGELKWREEQYLKRKADLEKGIAVKEKIIKLFEKALNGKTPQEENEPIEVPV